MHVCLSPIPLRSIHRVYIDYEKPNPFYPILHSIARLFFPITFALWLVQFTFR